MTVRAAGARGWTHGTAARSFRGSRAPHAPARESDAVPARRTLSRSPSCRRASHPRPAIGPIDRSSARERSRSPLDGLVDDGLQCRSTGFDVGALRRFGQGREPPMRRGGCANLNARVARQGGQLVRRQRSIVAPWRAVDGRRVEGGEWKDLRPLPEDLHLLREMRRRHGDRPAIVREARHPVIQADQRVPQAQPTNHFTHHGRSSLADARARGDDHGVGCVPLRELLGRQLRGGQAIEEGAGSEHVAERMHVDARPEGLGECPP